MELRRVTGHELVPHTWVPVMPRLEVVTATRSIRDDCVEGHRFADRAGESGEPTWVHYDPRVWVTTADHPHTDPFGTPLAWPE
ncbi:hypothetical protein KIH74_28940 [Kineosporia sp. J2-2]|uniref:Uncharacterized protein n=1 Tax=Kineosporia corallincola TaxID=2835133 RepID=A0ABS5TR97_9ACTN|nr:hypothetical protein [Kineosporia corallincola]MBT0773004.1 hypothetical protein [Kineosporia corallincola]